MDNYIFQEFKKLAWQYHHIPEIWEAVNYVNKCLDPNTPSHEISLEGLVNEVVKRLFRCGCYEKFEGVVKEVENHLRYLGYREKGDILTYQEHVLACSTPGGSINKKLLENNRFKPAGLFKTQKLTIAEARKARKLLRVTKAYGKFFGKAETTVLVTLEPLDREGNTIRDPQLVDENLNPVETSYAEDFPFRRK